MRASQTPSAIPTANPKGNSFDTLSLRDAAGRTPLWLTLYASLILAYFALDALTGSTFSACIYSFFSRCLFGIALILLARGIRTHPHQTDRILGCVFWLLILRIFVILPLNKDILGHNLFDEFLKQKDIQASSAAGMWPLFLITANVWKSWRKAKRLHTNAKTECSEANASQVNALEVRTALTIGQTLPITCAQTPSERREKNMNSVCRKILITYIALLALMLVFPPANRFVDHSNISCGFRFILSIGTYNQKDSLFISGINIQQLCLQVIIVSLIAAAAYLVFKDKKD